MLSARLALIASFLLAGIASADSDGLFCSGNTYIAWESRSFYSDGVHRLNIIPLSDEMGIGPEISIILPDFQAFSMRCDAAQVSVQSLSDIYKVDVSDWRAYRYIGMSPCSDCRNQAKEPVANLTSAESHLLPIHSASGRIEFKLEFTREIKGGRGIFEHTTIAKLIKTADGYFSDSRIILAETQMETID